jgi:hypothetical protein
MTTAALPSVWSASMMAWRDALRALNRMRRLSLAVLVILLLVEVSQTMMLAVFPSATPKIGFGYLFAISMYLVIVGILLAPFAVAIHRFVLLDEHATRYRIDPTDKRLLRFVYYAVLVIALTRVPDLVAVALFPVSTSLGWVADMILGIVAALIVVRVVILFPAVAVDAADPSWQRAAEDTKGHSWHVFFVLLVSVLPIVVFDIIQPYLAALAWSVSHLAWAVGVGSSKAASELIATAVWVATASHLYQALGRSSGQPAAVAII